MITEFTKGTEGVQGKANGAAVLDSRPRVPPEAVASTATLRVPVEARPEAAEAFLRAPKEKLLVAARCTG